MKFIVSRTSAWSDEKPCDEAMRDTAVTEYKVGQEMVREMKDIWSIELNTLDELMEFFNKHGTIVITDWWDNQAYKEIEIYDDYRE